MMRRWIAPRYPHHYQISRKKGYEAQLFRYTQFIRQILRLLPTPLPFDTLNVGNPAELSSYVGMGKLEWLGYNLVTA